MAFYKTTINIHQPKDPPWADVARNVRRVIEAANPIEMWRNSVAELTTGMGLAGDAGLIVGLFLDTINRFPLELRGTIVHGIINGLGLTLTNVDGAIEGSIDPVFPPIPPPEEAQSVVTPDVPEGMSVSPSGLIIPK